MKNFKKQAWWDYLDKVQQDLIKQSFHLVEQEENQPKDHVDYSFVVFPAAKAYEGFLKKLFFDLGLINRTQFSGDRFRIGRALNPAIYKEYPQESVYEKLTRFCGGEEISAKLWSTWKNSRNLVFHFFPEKENLISFPEAKKRVEEIIKVIDFSFKGCQVPKETQSFKKKTIRVCLFLYLFIFISWTIFRFFFSLPTMMEEGIIKPFLWLLPTLITIKYLEKRPLSTSLGFAGKNFENSLLAVFGLIFFVIVEGVVIGYFRYQASFLRILSSMTFTTLSNVLVPLATALVEEALFRGYFFNRLWEAFGKAWRANLLVTLGFLLIHLPISIFFYHLNLFQIAFSFFLLSIMSLGSGLLFSLTYNSVPSILWHFLWNWQVILGI